MFLTPLLPPSLQAEASKASDSDKAKQQADTAKKDLESQLTAATAKLKQAQQEADGAKQRVEQLQQTNRAAVDDRDDARAKGQQAAADAAALREQAARDKKVCVMCVMCVCCVVCVCVLCVCVLCDV